MQRWRGSIKGWGKGNKVGVSIYMKNETQDVHKNVAAQDQTGDL